MKKEERRETTMESTTMTITTLNVLNVVAFFVNISPTYIINQFGLFHDTFKTNGEVSAEYQTIITPVGWAFSIWGIIFTSQFISVFAQLFIPSLRQHVLVQEKGIGYNYIGTCLAQAMWTVVFGLEYIELSLVFMLLDLYFLLRIVIQQAQVTAIEEDINRPISVSDYWLLKFPFSLHCGWIVAASFVNFNLVLVKENVGATTLTTVAVFSLLGVLAAAAYLQKTGYAIPCALAWALWGIFVELGTPMESIQNTFSENTIDWVRYGAAASSLLIIIGVLIKAVNSTFCTRTPYKSATEESTLLS